MFPTRSRGRVTRVAPHASQRVWVPLLVGLWLSACGRVPPEQPIDFIDQACCSEADTKLSEFKGCLVGKKNCPKSHKWWMRGQVSCGPVDDAACAGGRCCTYLDQYDPEIGVPDEDWAPPGFPKKESADGDSDGDSDGGSDDTSTEPAPESVAPKPDAPAPPLTITVVLAGDGSASIEGDALDAAALKVRLCEVAKALPGVGVTVQAESDTAQAAVLEMLDVAKACGITSVQINQSTD